MCIKKKGGKNEPWMDRKKQVNKTSHVRFHTKFSECCL